MRPASYALSERLGIIGEIKQSTQFPLPKASTELYTGGLQAIQLVDKTEHILKHQCMTIRHLYRDSPPSLVTAAKLCSTPAPVNNYPLVMVDVAVVNEDTVRVLFEGILVRGDGHRILFRILACANNCLVFAHKDDERQRINENSATDVAQFCLDKDDHRSELTCTRRNLQLSSDKPAVVPEGTFLTITPEIETYEISPAYSDLVCQIRYCTRSDFQCSSSLKLIIRRYGTARYFVTNRGNVISAHKLTTKLGEQINNNLMNDQRKA
ncbi:hypothetical protein CLF_109767 [Clonorchis sinensis]|uniref:Uncharacterized protein n=1 Tax=Clonorchis sinensis TaxID=79923 RepID=G7YSW8_CLOSI|nr:hypothetical protein CLF_109767 [Clonorchis sinensis]